MTIQSGIMDYYISTTNYDLYVQTIPMKSIISTWTLILVSQFCFAQTQWVNYTNNNLTNDIIETDEGYWLSSYGGLCYIDTNTAEETYYTRGNSSIPSNSVFDLLMHPNQELWMTSSAGICRFSNGQFEVGPQNLSGVINITPDNKIVVGGYDSLYIQIADMNFEGIAYPDYIAQMGGIEVGNDGSIYVNAINFFSDSYVAIYKNGDWEFILVEANYESAITLDNNDRLWHVNAEGLKYYENQNWIQVSDVDSNNSFTPRKMFSDLDNNIIIEIRTDCPRLLEWNGLEINEIDFIKEECEDCFFVGPSTKNNNSYFATNRKKGIYEFSKTEIEDYKNHLQSPLKSNYPLTTLHPGNGNHYVIYTDAIQLINGNVWSDMLLPTGISGQIHFANLLGDQLWISDEQYLWYLENEVWNKLDTPNGVTGEIEFFVIGENDDLWIQSILTLARWKDNQWDIFNTGDHQITTSIIQDMVVDPSNGDLWVSTFLGVRHYDGTEWINYDLSPVNHAFSLAVSDQGTYVRKSGLLLLNNGNIDTIPMPPLGYYGSFESEMLFDFNKERLYLAGTNHLAVYENDIWEVYTVQNSGIYNGYTYDIKVDTKENIWLSGSGGGLEVFNLEGVNLSSTENHPDSKLESFIISPTLVLNDQIFLESPFTGAFEITLFNNMGSLLQSKKVQLVSGAKTLYSLPLLSSGVYFVHIHHEDRSVTKKIVKIY